MSETKDESKNNTCENYNVKGIRYCDKYKCNCGYKKSWNLSDEECEVHRPHGNGIIKAKNRARGKYT